MNSSVIPTAKSYAKKTISRYRIFFTIMCDKGTVVSINFLIGSTSFQKYLSLKNSFPFPYPPFIFLGFFVGNCWVWCFRLCNREIHLNVNALIKTKLLRLSKELIPLDNRNQTADQFIFLCVAHEFVQIRMADVHDLTCPVLSFHCRRIVIWVFTTLELFLLLLM